MLLNGMKTETPSAINSWIHVFYHNHLQKQDLLNWVFHSDVFTFCP